MDTLESKLLVSELIGRYEGDKKHHDWNFLDSLLIGFGAGTMLNKIHPLNSDGIITVSFIEAVIISRVIYNRVKYHQDKRALSYLNDLQRKLTKGEISNVNYELLNSKKNFRLAVNNFTKECRIQKRKERQLIKKKQKD